MAERPILFSAPMMRAILDNTKTQTRRLVSPKSFAGKWLDGCDPGEVEPRSDTSAGARGYVADPGNYPPFVVGDWLWVRETWRPVGELPLSQCMGPRDVRYAASVDEDEWATFTWRPSIHMPRWASRLRLEVNSVRVERLHEISEEDARAEGVTPDEHDAWFQGLKHVSAFGTLWDAINGKRAPWAINPWVWVVGFKRVEAEATSHA